MSSPDGSALRPLRRHLVTRFLAAPASDRCYGLGEGPAWDGDRDRLLWVDINAGAVHSGQLAGQRVTETSVIHLGETVGAVVCARDGELLVAGARRLYRISPGGIVSPGPSVIAGGAATRLNDGVCDPAGRFLVGSLALGERAGHEVLVRIGHDGSVVVIDDDLGMSNGLAFAPGGDVLYSIDTIAKIVWTRAYSPATGAVGRREAFLRLDVPPDGMCVDDQGNLWIAMWGAGEVRCYSPSAAHRGAIEVPAPNTTSVAFIGPALDTLLITTAAEQLTDAQRAGFPDSGRLFTARVDARGCPVAAWAGSGAWPERFDDARMATRP